MGGIEGTGANGFSSAIGGEYSDRKDTQSGLTRKITNLKKQLTKLEAADVKKNVGADDKNISSLIQSLEKRIDTLQKRLDKLKEANDGKCQTCENRKYQDGSDDPGVSFKTATKIKPEAAASAVKGHEMEHVYRNRAKAAREGKKVVAQSVTIHMGICPECGKPYVSGGVTKTTTKNKPEEKYDVGIEKENPAGSIFDDVA